MAKQLTKAKLLSDWDTAEFAKYVRSDQFTEQDYVDVLTGKYATKDNDSDIDIDNSYGDRVTRGGYFYDHEHSTPENNAKILDFYIKPIQGWDLTEDRGYLEDKPLRQLRNLFSDFQFSEQTLSDIINDPVKYGINVLDNAAVALNPQLSHLEEQKNLTSAHIHKIAGKYPEHMLNFIDHEGFDQLLLNKMLGNPKALANLGQSECSKLANNPYLTPKQIEDVATYGNILRPVTLNKLLDKIPEERRNVIIDEWLGIGSSGPESTTHTGGYERDSFEDSNLFHSNMTDEELNVARTQWNDEDNWDNWENANTYNEGKANLLAECSNLTDYQAEHIKRHGTFKQRYAMYTENKDIDARHGAEMWKKWYLDDTEHGYDSDDLKEQLKEDYRENAQEGIWEDARETAQGNYPFSEWLSDYGNEFVSSDIINEEFDAQMLDDMDNYDWVGENPNYDKKEWQRIEILEKLSDNNRINASMVEQAGFDLRNFRFEFDNEDDWEDIDEIKTEYQDVAPMINYADYDNNGGYEISDHEDYDNRWEEIQDKYKEKFIAGIGDGTIDTPDNWYEAYDESIQENMWEIESRLMDEHFDNSHQNLEYVPDRLKEHPLIANMEQEIREQQEQGEREKEQQKQIELRSYLIDHNLRNREPEHYYGEGVHHHQLLKDYSDANNGKIDMGRMIKLMPNLKDTWKSIFGNQGKLTSDQIQEKIDNIPKTKYDITFQDWKANQAQNVNRQNQIVFRLDHTPESLKSIKQDPELYNMFNKISETSQRSGHPTNNNTIAWARVDTNDPNNWFIDEVQSDFGSAARRFLEASGHGDKANLIQKIIDIHKNWRENLVNYVISSAKKNKVKKISTHSPESKQSHTGADEVHTVYKDSYKKIPRIMGFLPAPSTDLPLSDSGRKNFSFSRHSLGWDDHFYAYNHHRDMALVHNNLINQPIDERQKELFPTKSTGIGTDKIHTGFANNHLKLKQQHYNRLMEIDPNGYQELQDEDIRSDDLDNIEDLEQRQAKARLAVKTNKFTSYKSDNALNKPMKNQIGGHVFELTPKFFKKNLDLVMDLIKHEYLLNQLTEKTKHFEGGLLKNIDTIEDYLGYESLHKGSFQRKRPFDPQAEPKREHKIRESWAAGEQEEDKAQIPRMEGNARSRALRKLARDTEVRKHPETGERLYLMHRGMHIDEHGPYHGQGCVNYKPGTRMSWTPNFGVANEFGAGKTVMPQDINKWHTVSAWIPENHLHSSLQQYNVPFTRLGPHETISSEHEWIINHQGGAHHANMDALAEQRKQKQLDIDITAKKPARLRLDRKKYGKLAASEKIKILEDKDLPELKKLPNLKKLSNKHKALYKRVPKNTFYYKDKAQKTHNKIQEARKRGEDTKELEDLHQHYKKQQTIREKGIAEQVGVSRHGNIKKGNLKNTIAGGATALAILSNTGNLNKQPKHEKTQISQEQNVPSYSSNSAVHNIISDNQPQTLDNPNAITPQHSKSQILKAIAHVESSGGKNTKHKKLPINFHRGEQAYGKYGLTPVLIRETIKKHPDLNKQYGHISKYKGSLLHNALKRVPELEQKIAEKHYDRLMEQFGHNPEKIGFAWLNGILGTHRAIQKGQNLNNHWHVKKLLKFLKNSPKK